MTNVLIDQLKIFSDHRGDLVPLEFPILPFEVKRLFMITNVPPGEIRGGHSHYKCHQFFICLRGKIKIEYYEDWYHITKTLKPGETIYVPPGAWTSEDFLYPDGILLVLCSHLFDKSDYATKKPHEV